MKNHKYKRPGAAFGKRAVDLDGPGGKTTSKQDVATGNPGYAKPGDVFSTPRKVTR